MMRYLRTTTFILFLFLSCANVAAQGQHPWETLLEELTAQDDNDIAVTSDMYDILIDLEENPININTATRDDLGRIPFLSAQQIEDIEAYVYQYKGMKSVGELSMIESLDPTRRDLLTYFIYIGDYGAKEHFPHLADIVRHGRNELTATGNIPFYDREGDKTGKYRGPKYRHGIRYEFTYGKYVQAGIQGAQDAGEPFFADKNGMGYDHYVWYLVVRGLGRLKTLAVGQYKLRMGMGLVVNNDFGFGKMMTLSSLGRSTNSIRANTSRSAAKYMQGAAATVSVGKGLDATAFVSYRPIDATLDTLGNIRTIVTSGYHRTTTELRKKNNAHETTVGGNIHWEGGGFHLGATAVYTRFDRSLKPDTQRLYRRYAPMGNGFVNASVDYGYINHRIAVNGETAVGNSHGIATINSISFVATRTLSLLAMQRFYSKRYSSLLASSFSDGGHIQNESGIYIGGNWQATRHLSLLFYTDYAYFAQARYQVSAASHSWDNNITATWTTKGWTVVGRYHLKMSQKDNADHTALADVTTQRGRLSVGYATKRWNAKVQADMAYSNYKKRSTGYMGSATGAYDFGVVRLAATFGYFRTDDYASRIYSYERGPLYSFSFPAYYGRGIRYAVFARADISKALMVIVKVGTTDYFDRNHISTGQQMIAASSQTDMELQLRWKF